MMEKEGFCTSSAITQQAKRIKCSKTCDLCEKDTDKVDCEQEGYTE